MRPLDTEASQWHDLVFMHVLCSRFNIYRISIISTTASSSHPTRGLSCAPRGWLSLSEGNVLFFWISTSAAFTSNNPRLRICPALGALSRGAAISRLRNSFCRVRIFAASFLWCRHLWHALLGHVALVEGVRIRRTRSNLLTPVDTSSCPSHLRHWCSRRSRRALLARRESIGMALGGLVSSYIRWVCS